MPTINVLVEGGKASAGAPLGPALGPLGVNIAEVVAKINEKTKKYEGMKVPVKVIVDSSTKSVEIEVGSPPVSALIKKELNLQKGASNPKTEKIANLSMQQVASIAIKKFSPNNFKELKGAIKQVLGTCNSMGVHVEGKRAAELVKAVDSGAYDGLIKSALSEQE